jgi:hypothetical protein
MRARFTPTVLILLGLATAATSCRKQGESAAADSTFVHAMIDLRIVAQNQALDSASQARARDSVLRRYNTSAADLEATAKLIANNPDHAVELLRKIDNGVRMVPRPIVPTAPAPTAQPTPAPAAPAPTHK